MTAQFKRIREDSVMCTVQGCCEVAVFFFVTGQSRPIPAAYCEAHAADVAKRLGQPWPLPERKTAERFVRAAGVAS